MSDTLTAIEAQKELAEIWEDQAEVIERLDPEDPKAKVLRTCSQDLKSLYLSNAPEWVDLSVVQARTGWSITTLRRRARELEVEGKARKTPSGEWEITREAALELQVKTENRDLSGLDMDQMARVLGRER